MDTEILLFFDKHKDALPMYETLENQIIKEIATEPYPNRWTHYVLISAAEEIDDELMSWIKAAAAFSDKK